MSTLRLIPLGGMGHVTQNMYIYEIDDELLIVDCGIGFPDLHMPGVDILIPDISYLLKKLDEGKKIVGMVLTHGHDDHIAATPYILPQLPEFPIYASALTAGFARNRMEDGEVQREITVIQDETPVKIGTHFQIEAIPVTHSVPDTRHYVITTSAGTYYHGSDFKLDPNPVDGVQSDLDYMAAVGARGVDCLLIDCLRVERKEPVKSESTTGPVIASLMANTQGKFIITLMSSHIHRIQQTVDAAQKLGRKVTFIGRSVEQNVEIARQLKKLHLDNSQVVDKRDIDQVDDKNLCIIIAGSQGQEGSSLVRAIFGDHPVLRIKQHDKVVFSADAIPGNEIPYFGAIDELCRNGVDVLYPDIVADLHQSGHASAVEQRQLVDLIKPRYIMPIGGADRHRVKFVEFVAEPAGYRADQVLIPGHGDVLAFVDKEPEIAEKISLQALNVDGLGVGDVGPQVLSDRKTLGSSGIIVVVLPKSNSRAIKFDQMQIVSRGFVFMKEADEVIDFIKQQVREIVQSLGQQAKDAEVRKAIERRLGRKVQKVIQREPMIMTVFV